ncbi:MAG: hypothetical protein AAF849_16025 [Bacteroidota bacterium]
MYKFYFYALICLISIIACEKETCEPRATGNRDEVLSIHGKVLNYYTQKGEKGVKISILDQIGGSYILKWDSIGRSNQEGCFSFFYERDVEEIEAIFERDPPRDYSRIKQSIRSNDRRYFYLFTQQEENTPFGRWNYNTEQEISIYVVPNARLNFSNTSSRQEDYGFNWRFLDEKLETGLPRFFSYSLKSQNNWEVPASGEIIIEVYRSEGAEQFTVYQDTLLLEPQTTTQIIW